METTNDIRDYSKVYTYEKTHTNPNIIGYMDLWFHTDELILQGTNLKAEYSQIEDLGVCSGTVECTYQDTEKTVIYSEMYIDGELSMKGTDTIIHYKPIEDIKLTQENKLAQTNLIIKGMAERGFHLINEETFYDEYGFEYDEEHKKLHIYDFECIVSSDKTLLEAYEKIHSESDGLFFEENNIKRWGLDHTRDGMVLKAIYYYIIGEEAQ